MQTEIDFSIITSLTPYGQITVLVDKEKRKAYVVPRWISRDLKISWQGLRQKLGESGNPLKDHLEYKKIPTFPNGRKQFTVLLPISKLSEWARSIDPESFLQENVGPDLKEKLLWIRDNAYNELMPYVYDVFGERERERDNKPEVKPCAEEIPSNHNVNLEKVKFYDASISVFEDEEGAWVSLPNLCKAMHLDLDRQSRKLLRRRWAKTKMMTIPDEIGLPSETILVHEDTIDQWLATIDEIAISPQIYDTILLYQREFPRAVRQFFLVKKSNQKETPKTASVGGLSKQEISSLIEVLSRAYGLSISTDK